MHAATSKDMVLSGDWITPTVNGEPFFDKPAFHNWLVALAFVVFGFTEFAARLPNAMMGLGCVLVTYLLGRRLYGPGAAFLGAVVLATAAEFFVLSRTVMHDMSLAFFVTLGLALWFVGYSRNATEPTLVPALLRRLRRRHARQGTDRRAAARRRRLSLPVGPAGAPLPRPDVARLGPSHRPPGGRALVPGGQPAQSRFRTVLLHRAQLRELPLQGPPPPGAVALLPAHPAGGVLPLELLPAGGAGEGVATEGRGHARRHAVSAALGGALLRLLLRGRIQARHLHPPDLSTAGAAGGPTLARARDHADPEAEKGGAVVVRTLPCAACGSRSSGCRPIPSH